MEAKKQNEIINRELVIENNVLMENLQKANEKIENLTEENQILKNLEKETREKLDEIIYSRSYKLMQRIKKLIRRG